MNTNFTPLKQHFLTEKNRDVVGLINKEIEPSLKREAFIGEKVEVEPPQEIAPFVEVRRETVKLPPDVKKIGVKSTSIPVFSQFRSVKLPLSDEKIITGLHAPVTSSLRWLATLALYLLQIAHLQLKIVHGKAVRVFRK